jgi:hypothetical protein
MFPAMAPALLTGRTEAGNGSRQVFDQPLADVIKELAENHSKARRGVASFPS